MKIHLIKSKDHPRTWEWSVMEDGAELATGRCRTRRDAENDAAAWIEWAWENRAISAGRIPRGAILHILPEWMDPGDEDFTFIAIESQLPGQTHIRCRAIHKTTGQPGIGIQSIETRMIHSHTIQS